MGFGPRQLSLCINCLAILCLDSPVFCETSSPKILGAGGRIYDLLVMTILILSDRNINPKLLQQKRNLLAQEAETPKGWGVTLAWGRLIEIVSL